MKPIHNILFIDISVAILIIILFGGLLQFPYVIPLIAGGCGLINFALGGVFFLGQDSKLGWAFVSGGLVLMLVAAGFYGYMYFITPEKLNFMKDLADPQK